MNFREFPVFVPVGKERLCAIVCVPSKRHHDLGVVLLTGANYSRIHRNRMWVRTARELAERGYPSIRFDYHGIGDSTGEARFDLEEPFEEDACAASEFLREATGISKLSVIGTCFGSRTALAAGARDASIASIVLFPVKVLVSPNRGSRVVRSKAKARLEKRASGRRALETLLRWRQKSASVRGNSRMTVSSKVLEDLTSFLSSGDVWFVYGERSESLDGVRRCITKVESRVPVELRRRIHLEVIPGTELRRFQKIEDQDTLVARTLSCVDQTRLGLASSSSHLTDTPVNPSRLGQPAALT